MKIISEMNSSEIEKYVKKKGYKILEMTSNGKKVYSVYKVVRDGTTILMYLKRRVTFKITFEEFTEVIAREIASGDI